MWRLHLTLDKLEHLSTYACGEVTLGRFVNFGFKTFQLKDYGQKQKIFYFAVEREGKKKRKKKKEYT